MDVIHLRHSSIIYANAIQQLTQALADYHITYFSLIRVYDDQSRICLTSNPDWHSHFANTSIYTNDFFTIPDCALQTGHFLWDNVKCNKIYLSAKQYFALDHGITLIENANNYTDQFHFGSSPDILTPTDYINYLPILKTFAAHFLHQGRRLIHQSDKIMLPALKNIQSAHSYPYEHSHTLPPRLYLNYINKDGQQVYLTRAEVDCARGLAQGMSLSDIAKLRRTSRAVVDKQVMKMKAKLDCHKTIELVYKLTQSIFADIIFCDI